MIGSPEDRAKLRKVLDDQFITNIHGPAFKTEPQLFMVVLDGVNAAATGPLPSIEAGNLSHAIMEVIQEAVEDGGLIVVLYRHPADHGILTRLFFPRGSIVEFSGGKS